jgi:hypothetical protein
VSKNQHPYRLASNDNETIVVDELDTEGHRLAANDDESIETTGLRRRAR